MNRPILVPLDGSRFGEHALPTALRLAGRTGAPIELVTVALPQTPVTTSPSGTGIRGDESREKGTLRARTYLEEVSDRIRRSGYEGSLSTEVVTAGNTANSLVRRLMEVDAGLVVMTTHGRGPLQRAWLGSTADGVIRRSPCPVVLIRPTETEDDDDATPVEITPDSAPFRKVLVPLDGSAAAEELLRIAPPILDPAAEFVLLRVIAPLTPGGSPYLPHVVSETRDQEATREKARQDLHDAAERSGLGGRSVHVTTKTQGQAGPAILELAREEGVDLIAMSTTGRGGVSRMFLGSVADKVIRGAPCPVLIYRMPENEEHDGDD